MAPVLVILIVAIVLVADGVPGVPLIEGPGARSVVIGTIGTYLAIALAFHALAIWCGRRLDRTGRIGYLRLLERGRMLSRLGVLTVHAGTMLGLGWLEIVRGAIGGNLVLIDEAIVSLLPLSVIAAGWWSFAPIDRRLHEAALLRALDTGVGPPTFPGRLAYLLEHVRHDLLLLLIPIGAILAWSETVDWSASRLWRGSVDGSEGVVSGLVLVGNLLGVLAMVVLMPLVLRVIWRTVPLGPGPLRDRLTALCRSQAVRCRELLVWRTHSGLLNAAVIGIVPQLRYILLTETLLDRLGDRQIEAVMAHEVAHARCHHLPWLMLSLLGSLGGAWVLTALALDGMVDLEQSGERARAVAIVLAIGFAGAIGLMVFGHVSRRFEQQADAFAAQHLSGLARTAPANRQVEISEEAADAMISALDDVARFNCIPPERFMWRHGSIRRRQQQLRELVGRRAWRLPIDRRVDQLKLAAIGVVLATLVIGSIRPDLLPR